MARPALQNGEWTWNFRNYKLKDNQTTPLAHLMRIAQENLSSLAHLGEYSVYPNLPHVEIPIMVEDTLIAYLEQDWNERLEISEETLSIWTTNESGEYVLIDGWVEEEPSVSDLEIRYYGHTTTKTLTWYRYIHVLGWSFKFHW